MGVYYEWEKPVKFKRRQRRRRKRFPLIGCVMLCLFLFAAGVCLYFGALPFGLSEYSLKDAAYDDGWNLTLVNGDHPLAADYQVDLTYLSNGEAVDQRIYPDLQKMFDAARRDDIYPVVASGYRTEEKQQSLFDEKYNFYLEEGCTKQEALSYAGGDVAAVGYSEHQLGSAVDINADPAHSTAEEVYGWLKKHGSDYGFILRYPEDKTDLTGINYEPWHYRYVGKEAAKAMERRGLCLEEYVEEAGENR